jgi:electron transfer flavoprotein-quinone oxidoreductase
MVFNVMSVPEHFDAIVVGAGPAGSTAAYKLAEKGYNVLLIERGRVPGSKNVYGGKIYSHYIKQAYPNYEKEAPIHRWVKKERFSIISGENSVTLEYDSNRTPSFTTYLSQFTKWAASKAEEAGAVLVTEVTVEKLIRENGEVKGVIAGPDKVYGDIVILAEGANRLVSESAGIAPPPQFKQYALGIKETIKLDKKRINERFGLDDREGLSWIFLGDFLDGLPDGGFL